MKHELGGKIMKKLVRLRAKTYSQLQDNNNGYKKPKGSKKCVIKRKIKFWDFENGIEAAQIRKK